MYRLLIVDDERWIRKGIRARLAKHGFSFDWVGEADSGEAALKLIKEDRPDIVLVDIKMDRMNGLELMERARHARIEPKFIIITGHSDFSFAERAINEGARGYILKPIESRLFVQRLHSVIIELDHERETKGTVGEVLGARALNHDPTPPGSGSTGVTPFDSHLLQTASVSGAVAYSDGTPGRWYALAIIHIDRVNCRNWVMEVRAKEAIRKRLAAVLLPQLTGKGASVLQDSRSVSNLILVCDGRDQNQLALLVERATRVAQAEARKLGHSTTIGCSTTDPHMDRTLYDQAKDSLNARLFRGVGEIYRYEDDGDFEQVDEHDLRFLEEHIRRANLHEIQRSIRSIFRHPRSGRHTMAYLRDAHLAVVRTATRGLRGNDRAAAPTLDYPARSDEDFDLFDDTEQLADGLYRAIARVLDANRVSDGDDQDRVQQIREYIDINFPMEISTRRLATEFNLNANYLSTLFRNKTGSTISEYIAQVRVNAACRLLRETAMSVAETARTVGYSDPKYFHKVFRRIKGLTPGEFQKGNSNPSENSPPDI